MLSKVREKGNRLSFQGLEAVQMAALPLYDRCTWGGGVGGEVASGFYSS